MMQRDWRNPEDYMFTRDLSPELWAWQFLRRNPEYQQDYKQFIVTWRALEADYGKAPNRDFSRWKLDPRAYADDDLTQGICDDDKSCASPDGDQVMIECAMGAKWGFYKFPNAPDIEFPEVPDKLIWRELDIQAVAPAGEAQSFHMDLRFDLRLPLREQLDSARRQLISHHRQDQDAAFSVEKLTKYLRLIDAENSTDEELVKFLCDDAETMRDNRLQAIDMCRMGYRLLTISSINQ